MRWIRGVPMLGFRFAQVGAILLWGATPAAACCDIRSFGNGLQQFHTLF
jgi:hypothetical protein